MFPHPPACACGRTRNGPRRWSSRALRRKVRQQNILFVLSFMSLWNLGTLRASLAEHLSDRCSDSNTDICCGRRWLLHARVLVAGVMLGCSMPEFSSSLFSTPVQHSRWHYFSSTGGETHRTPVLPEVYHASHAHEVYTHTLRFRRTRRTRRTRAVVSLHIPQRMTPRKLRNRHEQQR